MPPPLVPLPLLPLEEPLLPPPMHEPQAPSMQMRRMAITMRSTMPVAPQPPLLPPLAATLPAPPIGRPNACARTAQEIGEEWLQLASPPPVSRERTSPPFTKSVI